MNVLITGCNGFLGLNIARYLSNFSDFKIMGVCRNKSFYSKYFSEVLSVNDLSDLQNLPKIMNKVDILIHTAGIANALPNTNIKEEEYFEVNSELTRKVALIASKYDVKKLIYISSIKVFDNSDLKRSTISNNSKENPKDIYGKSKLKAENYLKKASAESSIDYVIIRPPVIYGSGVKGNVHMLSKLIRTNIPLPLKTFKTNKRSMVSIRNICDLIKECCINPLAINKTFLVSDDNDLSTYEISKLIKISTKSSTIFFRLPKPLLNFASNLLGISRQVKTLSESSIINIEYTKKTLSWKPIESVEEAFEGMFT